MKSGAMVLAVLAVLLGDVSPKSGTFNPKRLAKERDFAAPGLWLMSPGGRFITTATGIDSFGLIDATTGRELGRLGDHTGGRHDGNWGRSDRILATTSNDGAVKVWDAITRKEVASLRPHAGYT
jgi:WD40 repeat protein